MTRIQKRVTKITVLVSMLGVFALGAAPALADNSINYYQGVANSQALGLSITPSSVVNVDLTNLANQLFALPAPLGPELQNLLGTTLSNVTGDINVATNTTHTEGVSNDGSSLATGLAKTTPVVADVAALNSQIALLRQALQDIPKATSQVLLNQLLAAITADPALSGVPVQALEDAINGLTSSLSDSLGHPAAHVFETVSQALPPGGDQTDKNVAISAGGIFTPTDFILGPFEAQAQSPQGMAMNDLTNLSLVPTGNIGLQGLPSSLAQLLPAIQTFLTNSVHALCNSKFTATVCNLLTLQQLVAKITPVFGTAVTALNALNSTYNTVVAAVNQALALGLGNINLNDIAGTSSPSTGLTKILRDTTSGLVTGSAIGDLANVHVLNLTNPTLLQILQAAGLGNLAGQSLLTIDGVKGTANVALDGTNPAKETATGQLLDIKVLGKNLADVTGISLDNFLAPGTSCTIKVPGGVTCSNLGLLGNVIPSIPAIDGLITITLTRGANVTPNPNASVTSGAASIVTLETTVNLDCSKIAALTSIVNGVTKNLPVTLTLCGGASQGPAAAHAASAGNLSTGGQLVDLSLGVANVSLSLKPGPLAEVTNGCTTCTAPNTGSSVWILGILAAFLVMAGAGIGIYRSRLDTI